MLRFPGILASIYCTVVLGYRLGWPPNSFFRKIEFRIFKHVYRNFLQDEWLRNSVDFFSHNPTLLEKIKEKFKF